jgi:peptidoglycan DL-endopeptidase CwlO
MTTSIAGAGVVSGSAPRPPSAAGAVGVVVVAAMTAVVVFTAVVGGATSGAQSAALTVSLATVMMEASEGCVIIGAVRGLDADQSASAGQIVSAAFAVSAENEALARVALMVAVTESGLRDLGPLPNNDGSLGLFQQRASQGWGTAAEELDPADATGMFADHLLAIARWSKLPPWVAAQDVQRSAWTGQPSGANGGSSVVGGNYRRNWPVAGAILTSVVADGNGAGMCGQGVPAGVVGPVGAHGLPAGYAVPSGTGPLHAKVVDYSLKQLGKPYVWAAEGPGSFDCSGLTMAAWATVGVHLLHYTGDQQHEGQPVTQATLMAGDLVLVPGSDSPAPGVAGHVGLYLGYGLVLSAIDPELGVAVQSWQTFTGGGLTALRDPDAADD